MDESFMSLDEIINRNRETARANRNPAVGRIRAGATAPGPVAGARRNQPKRVRDARDIICKKTRQKIVDARDRLNQILRQTDARYRLRSRANEGERQSVIDDNGSARRTPNRGRRRSRSASLEDSTSSGSIQYIPRPVTCYMDMEDGIDLIDRHYIPPNRQPSTLPISRRSPVSPQSINRTIRNEAYSMPSTMPPLPNFRTMHKVIETPLSAHGPTSVVDLPWSDPFGTYELMRRPTMPAPPAPLPVSAMMPAASMAARQPHGILRHRSRSPIENEYSHLSANMRARLERAPDPAESMGIFSKLNHTYSNQHKPSTTTQSKPAPPKPFASLPSVIGFPPSPPSPTVSSGYRIVVSNLDSKVIHEDIEELFAEIGDLMEARLVRPGVAEVIYRNLSDAEKAVEAYHNRQLDGKPMNCLLVHPRASNKPTAPALSTYRFGGR